MEGTIRVTATAKRGITAQSAKLHVKLEGERVVFGAAALEQSRELKDLVTRLKILGLEDNAFSVASVRVTGPGGLLKNSRAEFNLVVTETRLERLPGVIGAISETKNASLQHLEWIWDDFETSVPLAAEAMRKAQRKAAAMAEAVGGKLGGVRNASDSWNMPESIVMYDAMPMQAKALSRSREADIGMEYRAERELEVTVTVDFVVDG
jgi:Protein of unknown function (DUF541)